jgi:hypothetical protein
MEDCGDRQGPHHQDFAATKAGRHSSDGHAAQELEDCTCCPFGSSK